MSTIHNKITINASPKEVWEVLANLEILDAYDPVVAKSSLISEKKEGVKAQRHCDTADGGWFKEEVTEWQPYEKLTFTLFGCNQPMKSLSHSYTLKDLGSATEVKQVMQYTMKFGLLGKAMDVLMVRRISDKQIKLFFEGLKKYVETGKGKE